jgi:hypothetical protein
MTRRERKVYTRPATTAGQLGRALILLAVTILCVPLRLIWAIVAGLAGGTWSAYKANQPRYRRTE